MALDPLQTAMKKLRLVQMHPYLHLVLALLLCQSLPMPKVLLALPSMLLPSRVVLMTMQLGLGRYLGKVMGRPLERPASRYHIHRTPRHPSCYHI